MLVDTQNIAATDSHANTENPKPNNKEALVIAIKNILTMEAFEDYAPQIRLAALNNPELRMEVDTLLDNRHAELFKALIDAFITDLQGVTDIKKLADQGEFDNRFLMKIWTVRKNTSREKEDYARGTEAFEKKKKELGVS